MSTLVTQNKQRTGLAAIKTCYYKNEKIEQIPHRSFLIMVRESLQNKVRKGEIDQSWQNILLKLAQYLQSGDYISHLSALHLMGYYQNSCEVISVISEKRHRNRLIDGKNIQFIYRKKTHSNKFNKTVRIFASVPVAEPGIAWVDLLADLNYAPAIDILADLAQTIPMNVTDILNKAELISDTVLKRAAFILGWCGRLHSHKILNNRLSNSPAKLDFRATSSELLWDNYFKIFFPCEILDKKVGKMPAQNQDWLIFRNSPGFISALKKRKSLILRKDSQFQKNLENALFPTTPVDHYFLNEWFELTGISGISFNLTRDDLINMGEWLKPLINSTLHKNALLETAKQNSHKIMQNMELCSRLFVVALATEHRKLIDYCLRNWGENLFYYGKSGLISLAYPTVRDFNHPDMAMRAIITIAMITRGNFADANNLWEKTQDKQPSCGLFHLANAVTAHRNNNSAEAEKEYLRAISAFRKEDNSRLTEVSRIYLGNLFLGLKQFEQAKKIYLNVWKSRAKGNEISENFKGILMGNLGIVEFRLGNLRRSEKLLIRSIPLCKNSANEGSLSLLLYFLAYVKLGLGKPIQALAIARESWNLKQKTGNEFTYTENIALIILLNRIIGRHEKAAYWMGLLKNKSIAGHSTYLLSKGYELLFNGEISQALIHFKKAEQTIEAISPSSPNYSQINTIIALISLKNKAPADNFLSETFKYHDLTSAFPDRFNTEVVEIMLITNSTTRKKKLDSLLEEFCKTKYFDPIWFLVFELTTETSPGASAKFLEIQYHLSPDFIKNCAQSYFHNNEIACKLQNKLLPVAKDKYVYVNSQETSLISKKEYLELTRNTLNAQSFFFNGITGEVFTYSGKGQIRNSSIQARLLSFLLQSRSDRVPIPRVYEAVWQTPFYEDFDLAVVKSTISRLNRLLNYRFTSIQLKVTSVSFERFVEVKLPEAWQAVLPLRTF